METIIVYLDDADYALPLLESVAHAPAAANTHWVVIACAPRITHRVSKFVSNRSRENWRNKWSERLFAAVLPSISGSAAKTTAILARGPLAELLAELQTDYADAQVVDLRRPKAQTPAMELVPGLAPARPAAEPRPAGFGRYKLPGTLAGMAALLGLLFEEMLVL